MTGAGWAGTYMLHGPIEELMFQRKNHIKGVWFHHEYQIDTKLHYSQTYRSRTAADCPLMWFPARMNQEFFEYAAALHF